MRAAVPVAIVLLGLVPAQAGHQSPPLILDDLHVSYGFEPKEGEGGENPTPWTFHTYVTVKVTNPLDVNVTNVTAVLYAGAEVTVEKSLVFPLLLAEETRTFTFDVNTVPSPYWCIQLGHKQARPPVYAPETGAPYTGFQTGECVVAENVQGPPLP